MLASVRFVEVSLSCVLVVADVRLSEGCVCAFERVIVAIGTRSSESVCVNSCACVRVDDRACDSRCVCAFVRMSWMCVCVVDRLSAC